MKISKLKYVFAFLLVVTLSVVSVPVVKAVGFKTAEMDISTVRQNLLAAIEDGDEPTTSTYANTIAVFNLPYSIGSFNPVHSYAIQNTASGMFTKVYGLTYAQNSENKDGIEFDGNGAADNVGLALAFGLSSLPSSQAGNQQGLDSYTQARSMATQAYIWATQGNYQTIRGGLTGTALSEFDNIAAKVEKAQKNVSYTYDNQTVAASNAKEMTWNAAAGRYEITLTDANGLDTTELINVIIEAHPNIHYTKNGNSVTFFTTEQIGTAENPITLAVYKSINNGNYRTAYARNVKSGQRFVYLSSAPVGYENTARYISFYTNALRVRVSKTLESDPGKTTNKGDAKVSGAVYGVYTERACQNEVAKLVTGTDGTAITRPLEYKTYYVKELTQAEGCKIDTNVYEVVPTNAVDENGQKVVTINSKERIIYGGMRLIVSSSDLSGNTTKQPSAGSMLELTLDSDPNQKYPATVNDIGYAEFLDIPYGHYTCKQITKVSPDQDLMDPMSIYIDREETYVYSKLVNTETAKRFVEIRIRDKGSKKLITGSEAVFKIFDVKNNRYVVQTVTYSEDPNKVTPYQTDTFSTDNRGYVVTAEMLPYTEQGYRLEEVTAPNGYYNVYAATKTSIPFTVPSNTVENPEHEDVVVTVDNVPQVHEVNIYTAGDVLSGSYDKEEAGQTAKNPAYTAKAIPGVRYEITANEDIKTDDGTVQWPNGLTKSYTTDETGLFTLKLYAGSYTLKQVAVPEGYVLDSTPRTLTYDYKGQLIETVPEPQQTFSLRRQTYDVSLTKAFGDAYFYRQVDKVEPVIDTNMYTEVTFGIYAKNDIKNVLGQIVYQKGQLVNAIRTGTDGIAHVTADLPMGEFYAKELTTNENYDMSKEEYAITCKPTNFSDLSFVVDGGQVLNTPKKITKATLTKIEEVEINKDDESLLDKAVEVAERLTQGKSAEADKVTVLKLEGAEYKVFYENGNAYYPLLEKVDGKLVEVVRTTDEDGEIVLEGLPFGKYAVEEVTAPRYYELSKGKFGFEVTAAKPEVEGLLKDERTLLDMTVTVVDEDGNVVPNAMVELVDTEIDNVYSIETDENGVASFEDVRAGRYIRRVSGLEEKYVLPEDKEIYVEKGEELAEEVEVRFVVGNIVVYKTDDETGEPVPGCTFQVLDYETGEVIEEQVTDENGYARFEGYRYGKYLVQESEAAEDYEKSEDVMEVTIVEDGVDVVVSFTNVYTADIAVALYGVVALVSIFAIVKLAKRMKRD